MSASAVKNVHFIVPATTGEMYKVHFPKVVRSLKDDHHFEIREEVIFRDPVTGNILIIKKDSHIR